MANVAIVLSLSQEEVFEPGRIVLDDDEAASLGFLKRHLSSKLWQALNGTD